jgi:hypothetical protein
MILHLPHAALVAVRMSASIVLMFFMIYGIAVEVPNFFNLLATFGLVGTITAFLSAGVLLAMIAMVGSVLWNWALDRPYSCQGT